jgi:NAD+ diphosphatase
MDKNSIYNHHTPALNPQVPNPSPSYWFIFSGNRLLVKEDSLNVTIPFQETLSELNLNIIRTQYLGTLHAYPSYSCEADLDAIPPENMIFRDLRSLFTRLPDELFQLAGKAIQIVTWDQTHQYCSRCGSKVEVIPNERAKKCPSCDFITYPRISPATITAIFKGDKILLAHAHHFPGDMHSLIAGFLEAGETLEDCVRREIMEEVNLKVKNIQYWGSQPWPYPNSMMIGFTAEYESGDIEVDGIEIEKAAWYDIHHLPELPSELSIARKIINWYVKEMEYGNIRKETH